MDAQANVDVRDSVRRGAMGSGFKWSAISAGLVLIGWARLASSFVHAEEPARPFNEQFGPFLKSHCVSCHSGEKPKGKLSLDNPTPDLTDAAARKQWAAVAKRLQAGEMPPKDKPRPP